MRKLIILGLLLLIPCLANAKIKPDSMWSVDTEADEECLTYEATSGKFEWQACATTGSNYCSNVVSLSHDPTNSEAVTYYLSLAGMTATATTASATQTSVDNFVAPVALTAHSLRVQLDGSSASLTDPWVITLIDDAAASTLTCSISGTAVANCTDTTNLAAIAAGSKLSVSIAATGALASAPTDVSEALISFCTN